VSDSGLLWLSCVYFVFNHTVTCGRGSLNTCEHRVYTLIHSTWQVRYYCNTLKVIIESEEVVTCYFAEEIFIS